MKMASKYTAMAHKSVGSGSLVWVHNERAQMGTSRKLNAKWLELYQVVEVIRDRSAYCLRNAFNGQKIQRAAEKVKTYRKMEWILGP